MNYYTSDSHFGHKNILRLDDRPFADLAEMESELVRRWNEVVQPDDTVYHLGDVAFLGSKATRAIVERLNGRKVLIRGNHDGQGDRAHHLGFDAVYDSLVLEDEGELVYLTHAPAGYADHNMETSLKRPLIKPEVRTILHGHVHTAWACRLEDDYSYLNVGCMWWDYAPVSLFMLLLLRDLNRL